MRNLNISPNWWYSRTTYYANSRINKKSRIYDTSDLSISFAKLIDRRPLSQNRPLSPLPLSHVICVREAVCERGQSVWDRLCAREAMFPCTQPLLHRSHDFVGEADLCKRGRSVWERPICVREANLCERDHAPSHMAYRTQITWLCGRGQFVRERPCAREAMLSDWLREITWVSERGCVRERPILRHLLQIWPLLYLGLSRISASLTILAPAWL